MNLHNFTAGAARNAPMPTLTDDRLRQLVPSAFAESAHDSRSERYAYIPTFKVIDALRREGFAPTQAGQSASRLGRSLHTKHMIKFSRLDAQGPQRVGDTVPQVALVNSHDGSSAYSLIAGLYRLVCSNGLMVADSTVESIRVPHTGDIVNRVIEGSYTVIEGAGKAAEVSDDWRAITLTDAEAGTYANAAALLRWDGDKGAPIHPTQMLKTRRSEDNARDLWTTFNVVQENLVRGGQRGRDANARRFTVRPVNGIDGNVKLNRALWALTEQMATLKQAA